MKLIKFYVQKELKDLLISTYDGGGGVRDVALSIICETKLAAMKDFLSIAYRICLHLILKP